MLLKEHLFFLSYYLRKKIKQTLQEIFRSTPHEKQVMMFSATLSKDVRPVCKKFMQVMHLGPVLLIRRF